MAAMEGGVLVPADMFKAFLLILIHLISSINIEFNQITRLIVHSQDSGSERRYFGTAML